MSGAGNYRRIDGGQAASLVEVSPARAGRSTDAIVGGRSEAPNWIRAHGRRRRGNWTFEQFLRYATRRRGFLVASLLVGFVVGVAYRAFLDEANSRSVANYLRSGFDGLCIAWAAWAVQTGIRFGRPVPPRRGAETIAARG